MTGRGTLAMAMSMAMASIGVAAVVSAPIADALPDCQTSGETTMCRTNGSVAIKSRPGTTARPANQPQINWHIGRRR
jgi:hypothetical protein